MTKYTQWSKGITPIIIPLALDPFREDEEEEKNPYFQAYSEIYPPLIIVEGER